MSDVDPDLGPQSAGMPRWVKAFVIVGAVVAVLAVVSLLFGGDHGPGRHFQHGFGVVAPVLR